MSTFSFAAHSSHSAFDALLPPGTQWSQKPTDSFPAACAPRTCGMASAAAVAAVVCRKRRRVCGLVRIEKILPLFATPPLLFRPPPARDGRPARRRVPYGSLGQSPGLCQAGNLPRRSIAVGKAHREAGTARPPPSAVIQGEHRTRRSSRPSSILGCHPAEQHPRLSSRPSAILGCHPGRRAKRAEPGSIYPGGADVTRHVWRRRRGTWILALAPAALGRE